MFRYGQEKYSWGKLDLGRHLTAGLHHGKVSSEPGEGSRAYEGVTDGLTERGTREVANAAYTWDKM